MNLFYGQIVAIVPGNGMLLGKIRVGGAIKEVPLQLLSECQIGDRILICDGIAISKEEEPGTLDNNYVSSNPG